MTDEEIAAWAWRIDQTFPAPIERELRAFGAALLREAAGLPLNIEPKYPDELGRAAHMRDQVRAEADRLEKGGVK